MDEPRGQETNGERSSNKKKVSWEIAGALNRVDVFTSISPGRQCRIALRLQDIDLENLFKSQVLIKKRITFNSY
ncbi:hypothetical protein MYX76_13465 [Desulfobacterota bacterium AH_259_B03_O07]|nr:hypothetical protein [Desulfobacterota bacterium AH_259_B03_O07]